MILFGKHEQVLIRSAFDPSFRIYMYWCIIIKGVKNESVIRLEKYLLFEREYLIEYLSAIVRSNAIHAKHNISLCSNDSNFIRFFCFPEFSRNSHDFNKTFVYLLFSK
jgi:hypothetical protein